jgi:glycerophosphoryl diester phosphodiesterase
MLLLGHRGSLRHAPENTLESFEIALEHGCDGFEFDVRLTVDGRAAVFHDPAVAGVIVSDATFEELRQAASRNRIHVPSLREVWTKFAQRCFLNVELKVPGLEERVLALYAAEAPTRGLLVSSFVPEVVESLHRASNQIPLGYICKDPAKLDRWRELPIETAVLHFSLISPELVAELRAEKKKIYSWTVNAESEMKRLRDLGIDGIISDDTAHLCRVFGRNPGATPPTMADEPVTF